MPIYYQHAGSPASYVYNWNGGAPSGLRAAETRSLGADYIDVSARFHKELSDYTDYPVSMSQYSKTRSVLRPGPEQGKMIDGLGFFGALSGNERRLLMIGGAALAGWFIWKRMKR
jgi:hypothetical protein